MKTMFQRVLVSLFLLGLPSLALAQTALPTTQPNMIQIWREDVKVGRTVDHARIESGWVAAYEKAKFPYSYIGLVSMTGTPEAWFVSPFESHAAMADMLGREAEPALAAELARLGRADAEAVNNFRIIQARARKELSYGPYPDISKQRFFEISIFRIRPGREEAFAAAAKAYGAAVGRAGAGSSFRVYEVTAGMPGPTYLLFSSVANYADFDKGQAADEAVMKAMTADDMKVFEKYAEGAINVETHRFRLSPEMSYVPKEVRAQDPAFWMPKRPVAKAPAAAAAPAQ